MNNCKKSVDKKFFSHCNDCRAQEKPNIDFLCLTAKNGIDRETKYASLFFVRQGKIDVSYRNTLRTVEEGHFFLIPSGETYSIRCTDNAQSAVCALNEKLLVLHRRTTGLLYDVYNVELPDFEDCELFTLKTNRHIQALLSDCRNVTDNGLLCAKYTQCKTEELLILLRSYYPDESLARLFQPAFNSNVDFEMVVNWNRDKLFTVEEFAAATHLDRDTFRYRFKEIYGESPVKWISREREALVLRALTEGEKPISSIISDYKFSHYPNFIRFCNTHFKNTPGNIRKNSQRTT
ncbi:MAG: AraC family transcriptional regulator [Dysgonamonadaceae bacterium]|jgi:AraC-like DNA-binding protein|nr:AraC family transcriptional regulator [Dysgonamonadaceae bacterium]